MPHSILGTDWNDNTHIHPDNNNNDNNNNNIDTISDDTPFIQNTIATTTTNMTIDFNFRNTTNRPRDIGKYHGGSVLLTFGVPDHPSSSGTATTIATMTLQYLLHLQQQQQQHKSSSSASSLNSPHWLTPLRIQYHYHPNPINETTSSTIPLLSTEELQLLEIRRRDRAASYQRRRVRIANTTDHILMHWEQQLLYIHSNTGIEPHPKTSQSNRNTGSALVDPPFWSLTNKDINTIHVLDAPILNWTTAPSIIDPAIGGGLQPLPEHATTVNTTATSMTINQHTSNRATRKRAAVEAFDATIRHLLFDISQSLPDDFTAASNQPAKATTTTLTIADLGCGAGNLALPLAWWLNHSNKHSTTIRVLGIDLNTISLQRLRDRTIQCCIQSHPSNTMTKPLLVETLEMDLLELLDTNNDTDNPRRNKNIHPFQNCAAVVSLHACGAASDLAMMAAIQHRLPFIISPCCIGKTLTVRSGGLENVDTTITNNTVPSSSSSSSSSLHAKNHHRRNVPLTMPTQRGSTPFGIVSYPRSQWFQQNGLSYDQYRLIAAAADYGVRQKLEPQAQQQQHSSPNNISTSNDMDTDELVRYQRQRRAKRLVEMDRLQYAYEQGYHVRLLELPRIGSLYTKREVLIGVLPNTTAADRLATLPTIHTASIPI
jgi:hypothetical protein